MTQINLHPKMISWLRNELVNGRYEVEDEVDEMILQDTLRDTLKALTPPDPFPEGSFTVEVGRDATVYFTKTFLGVTLDDLKARMSKYGLDDLDLEGLKPDWDEGPANTFDNVEIYRVYDHEGNLIFDSED